MIDRISAILKAILNEQLVPPSPTLLILFMSTSIMTNKYPQDYCLSYTAEDQNLRTKTIQR